MSDFEQTSPLDTPDDGWYLSDAEMDAMTADELEAAFALALDSMTEDTYDGEVISRFLDAMDRKDPMPEHPNVETSYAGFQKKMNSVSSHEEPAEPMIRPRRVRRVSRALLAAAVSVAVIFGSLFTAQALGVDVFGTLARWTDDFFSFDTIRTDSETGDASLHQNKTSAAKLAADVGTIGEDGYDTAEYASLQDALDAYGFSDVPLAPNWFPDGYELMGVEVYYDGASSLSFYSDHRKGELLLTACITLWDDSSLSHVYSKDDDSVAVYESGGITHYIMSNNDTNVGAWQNGSFECSIAGSISQEELKKMIDSIYGG